MSEEPKAGAILAFEPGEGVTLFSGEIGVVLECRTGTHEPEAEYLVRYVDAVGRAQERWWGESALEPEEEDDEGDGDEAEVGAAVQPSKEPLPLAAKAPKPRTLH